MIYREADLSIVDDGINNAVLTGAELRSDKGQLCTKLDPNRRAFPLKQNGEHEAPKVYTLVLSLCMSLACRYCSSWRNPEGENTVGVDGFDSGQPRM